MGLEALSIEIFDELVTKGFAVRSDEPDGTPAIEWTALGKAEIPSGFDWLVEELASRVRSLRQRRSA